MKFEKNNLICVENILQDVLTGEIFFELSATYRNSTVRKTIRRSELTVKGLRELADVGFPLMTRAEAEKLISCIVSQEDSFPLKKVAHNVGWHSVDEKQYFFHRYAVCEGKAENITYCGSLDLSSKGKLKDNVDFLNSAIKDRVGLQAICAVSLSSAIVGMINDRDLRFIFHIGGASTTGKTTSLMLAGSLWGNPSICHNGIVRNFNITDNKLIQSMNGNKGIMSGLDELIMLKADKTQLTYLLTGGTDKQIMNDTDSADNEFRTVFISTGEIQFKASNYGGISVRLLETKGYNFTDNKAAADLINKEIFNNYGNIGIAFAKCLSQYFTKTILNALDRKAIRITDKIRTYIAERNKTYSPLYGRMTDKIAAIALAASLAKNKLGINFEVGKIVDFLITETTLLEGGEEQAVEAVEKFMEVYLKNQKRFPSGTASETANIWGKTVEKDGKISEIIVLYDQFISIMNSIGYPDSGSIIKTLKEKGFIKCEAGKNYSRRKVGNNLSVKVIVLNITAFEGREQN